MGLRDGSGRWPLGSMAGFPWGRAPGWYSVGRWPWCFVLLLPTWVSPQAGIAWAVGPGDLCCWPPGSATLIIRKGADGFGFLRDRMSEGERLLEQYALRPGFGL